MLRAKHLLTSACRPAYIPKPKYLDCLIACYFFWGGVTCDWFYGKKTVGQTDRADGRLCYGSYNTYCACEFWLNLKLLHFFCSVTCDLLYGKKTVGPRKHFKEALYSNVSCYRADATNTNGRAFYSNASCYRADARNTIWRQKYSSIATMWLCRWTRCCYRAHWHGMVVYNWWCDVDFHFWTLCKLLCCNADSWNMQAYLHYVDEKATAICIRRIDKAQMLVL